MKLDVGCGNIKRDDYVGIDFNQNADVVHDLNSYPYPFPDSTFEYIWAHHVLEHLDDLVKAMNELHRLAIPNGIIEIHVPHWISAVAWGNPTHKRGFTHTSFNNFEGKDLDRYTDKTFKLLTAEFSFLFHEVTSGRARVINKVVNHIINSQKVFYERILCHYIGGADEVIFRLQVIK